MYTIGTGTTWQSVTDAKGRNCLYVYETIQQAAVAVIKLGGVPFPIGDLDSLVNNARLTGVNCVVKHGADGSVKEINVSV